MRTSYTSAIVFIKVAIRDDIPVGEGRSFEFAGRRIAIFNVEGEFHAIDDVCVHRGGPLGDGPLKGCVVVCPWHGWKFDVTTGRNPEDSEIGVPTYTVRITGDAIEVEI